MGLSLIGQTNTTQIMRPATQIMRPATQIMRPATQIMRPATQIMRPATQIMRPATQIMRPATQITRTTKRRGEHAYIKTCTTMVSTKWFMKIKLENLGKTLRKILVPQSKKHSRKLHFSYSATCKQMECCRSSLHWIAFEDLQPKS